LPLLDLHRGDPQPFALLHEMFSCLLGGHRLWPDRWSPLDGKGGPDGAVGQVNSKCRLAELQSLKTLAGCLAYPVDILLQ
jgi:hypothetical protein